MKISLGMLLLGIYLIAVGVFPLLGLTGVPPWGLLLHGLAIAAGVAILLRR